MNYFLILISFLSMAACNSRQSGSENGTPVSGAFKIYCDETYLPVVQVLTESYMAAYPQVVITIDTTYTSNAYTKLDDRSTRTLITGIPLSANDSIALSQRNIFPNIFHFATDAVVFISKIADDSVSKYKIVLSENKCLQEMITPPSEKFITDRTGSENNRYINSNFIINDRCSLSLYSTGNKDAILKRISEHNDEIGIIGWSHLCEKENPEVKKIRAIVNVIPFYSDSSNLIYPTQSALMTGKYPLSRKLFLVTSEPYAGPATGFAAYVASDEGQRIIRLFGLAPYKTPPRELFVN